MITDKIRLYRTWENVWYDDNGKIVQVEMSYKEHYVENIYELCVTGTEDWSRKRMLKYLRRGIIFVWKNNEWQEKEVVEYDIMNVKNVLAYFKNVYDAKVRIKPLFDGHYNSVLENYEFLHSLDII